jgi:hypothetical protein
MHTTRAKLGPVATGAWADHVAPVGGAGGVTGAAQVATLFNKQTAFGGHKGRGRFFLPACPESNVDPGGVLTAGTLTTAAAAGVALLAALALKDIPMVLLHGDVTAPYEVDALTPSRFVATQRGRQPRGTF